ncbi:MAG: hypothetical protein U0441_15870 [Polyangiaceae bacterium]
MQGRRAHLQAVARLDPDGNARWIVGSTGDVSGEVLSVALGAKGDAEHVLFAGAADGDWTMGGVSRTGGGGKDAFVGLLAY